MQNNLRVKRKEAGLLQEEVAKLSGITTRVYQHYEYGDRVPGVYAALKLAKALNTTVEMLFSTSN